MERANYDLELYAKALEAMGDAITSEYPPIGEDEDPFEYAKNILRSREYFRGLKLAYQRTAEMLRGTPMSLYTVYPDHFPDPREAADAPLPQEASGD